MNLGPVRVGHWGTMALDPPQRAGLFAVRPTSLASEFVAGAFHVPIGKTQALTRPAKPGARLHIWFWEFVCRTKASYRHFRVPFLLRFQNDYSAETPYAESNSGGSIS